jgi:hypothetical protein
MKFKPINFYTRAEIKAQIMERMLDHPSINFAQGHVQCAYKAPDGNHCAVGVFVPEGHPAETSLFNFDDTIEKYPDLRDRMSLPHEAMRELQELHDGTIVGADPRLRLLAWIDAHVED